MNQEIYWINEQLIFEGEQLADIIHVLNDVFKTDIQLLCHKASNYPIISNHQHEDLEEILEVICTVHNLKLSKETVNGKDSFSISCND